MHLFEEVEGKLRLLNMFGKTSVERIHSFCILEVITSTEK